MHEINTHTEDIKVGGHHESYYCFPSAVVQRFVKKKMRLCYSLIFILALCIIVECGGTELTRVARTLPASLSPSNWLSRIRSLWSGGRFWEWPRNGAEGILRLVTSPDTRKKMIIEFKPEDGPLASHAYQSRYGYRGQWLIDLLGSGFHPDSVSYQQPMPVSILVPPPPPF